MSRQYRIVQYSRSMFWRVLFVTALFVHQGHEVAFAGHHFPPANAAMTIEVVDSRGNAVEGASCRVGFLKSYGNDSDVVRGVTDTNGHCFAQGKTYGEAVIQVSKDGYYRTYASYVFERNPGMADQEQQVVRHDLNQLELYPPAGQGEYSRGKWTPWNPVVQVPLKEKRNPIPLLLHSGRVFREEHGEPVGFDLEMFDWVEPYGRGQQADLTIGLRRRPSAEKEQDGQAEENSEFVFSAGAAPNGFVEGIRDPWSFMSTPYEAPETGYVQELRFEHRRRNGPVWFDMMGEEDYCFVRCRAVVDDSGRILHARYGKIRGISYGAWVNSEGKPVFAISFAIWLNPTDCDRNLEYFKEFQN